MVTFMFKLYKEFLRGRSIGSYSDEDVLLYGYVYEGTLWVGLDVLSGRFTASEMRTFYEIVVSNEDVL